MKKRNTICCCAAVFVIIYLFLMFYEINTPSLIGKAKDPIEVPDPAQINYIVEKVRNENAAIAKEYEDINYWNHKLQTKDYNLDFESKKQFFTLLANQVKLVLQSHPEINEILQDEGINIDTTKILHEDIHLSNFITLVSGIPRSGTSITGNILDMFYLNYTYMVFEPMNKDTGMPRNCHQEKFQVDKIGKIFPYQFYNLTSLEINASSLNYNNNNPHSNLQFAINRLSLAQKYFNFLFDCKNREMVIMKDPIALYSVDWFYRTYFENYYTLYSSYVAHIIHPPSTSTSTTLQHLTPSQILQLSIIKVVIVVRHPAGILSSWKNLGWTGNFSKSLEHYIQYQSVIQEYWKRYKHDPNWIFSRYEDFCRNPLEYTKQWFLLLDIPAAFIESHSEFISSKILEQTGPQNPKDMSKFGINRLSCDDQIDSWKHRLTRDEVEIIKSSTEYLWRTFYSHDDWIISPS